MALDTCQDSCQWRLCYVEGNVAWFTTAGLDRQWGDDWDDAPYEYNAGRPYGPRASDEPWELSRIVFLDADLETPDTWSSNGSWSVLAINQGRTPWLVSSQFGRRAQDPIRVFAGACPEDFKEAVREAGGRVFVEERIPLGLEAS